jgi:membrane protease subunit (stomatin/prohibitin family)
MYYRITDPKLFFTEVSGTRERYTVDDMEQQLRNQMVADMARVLGAVPYPFLTWRPIRA